MLHFQPLGSNACANMVAPPLLSAHKRRQCPGTEQTGGFGKNGWTSMHNRSVSCTAGVYLAQQECIMHTRSVYAQQECVMRNRSAPRTTACIMFAVAYITGNMEGQFRQATMRKVARAGLYLLAVSSCRACVSHMLSSELCAMHPFMRTTSPSLSACSYETHI